jgi:hypothetical protein
MASLYISSNEPFLGPNPIPLAPVRDLLYPNTDLKETPFWNLEIKE